MECRWEIKVIVGRLRERPKVLELAAIAGICILPYKADLAPREYNDVHQSRANSKGELIHLRILLK